MGVLKFIKNGGLFGKMRGFDSAREGHWYSFREFREDIRERKKATIETAEIPAEVKKTLAIGNNKKQDRIESNVNDTKWLKN